MTQPYPDPAVPPVPPQSPAAGYSATPYSPAPYGEYPGPPPEAGGSLGVRILRLALGILVLAIGVVLVTGSLFQVLRIADSNAVEWGFTLAGIAALLVAWVLLPGPVPGRLIAAVISLVAALGWVFLPVFVVGLWQDPDALRLDWLAAPIVFSLPLIAWLIGRGRALVSLILVVLPIGTYFLLSSLINPLWFYQIGSEMFLPLFSYGSTNPLAFLGQAGLTVLVIGTSGLISALILVVPGALVAALVPGLRGRYHRRNG